LAWLGLNLCDMLHLPWCGIKCWLPWCRINLWNMLPWCGINLHVSGHLLGHGPGGWWHVNLRTGVQ